MPKITRRESLACLPLAGVPSLFAGTWPRYPTTLPLDLRIPAKHPYLVLTPDQIEHAKERARSSPWAKHQMDHILSESAGYIDKPLGQLPPRANTQHRAIGARLFTTGLAYSFSGDQRYAEWVRDGLLAYAALYPMLAYAALYPMLAFTRGRHKLFEHSLYEATWIVAVAEAYDLVADSGVFTADQARSVENDLLRASTATFKVEDFEHDDRLKDLHFRCYNFQAWNIAAAGLVGLATHDRDLVEWAVNSPYGFRHLVAHDVRDDGIFWERSEGYHEFVMRGLLGFTEAMAHCGVDLYNMSVPNDRRKDESENYVTDTSDRPKSLRLMFESLFYLTFPDLTLPALGDAGPGPLRANAPFLVGYHRYRDPKLAWLIHRTKPDATDAAAEWHWLVYDPPADAPAGFPIREGSFANTGQYRNGCSLFPSTGVAVLRQASGDYTTQPDSTAVSLSYGPHGGGHGHSDNMNIVLYAQGRQWIPAFGSMPYETHWKNEWTAQTVSHNTIVVDGVSQYPTGTNNVQWPHDDATDRVVGVLDRFDPERKSARAHCDRAYQGIRLERAVRVDGNAVVDVFTASDAANTPHQYDYVLHIDGELERASLALESLSGKLGDNCGYQLIEQKKGGIANGSFDLHFAAEGKRLRVWVPAAGETEVVIADGLTNKPDRKMTMLILRRKASAARFVTVLEPLSAGNAIRAVRTDRDAVIIDRSGSAR